MLRRRSQASALWGRPATQRVAEWQAPWLPVPEVSLVARWLAAIRDGKTAVEWPPEQRGMPGRPPAIRQQEPRTPRRALVGRRQCPTVCQVRL
jgi:hypothetical protein